MSRWRPPAVALLYALFCAPAWAQSASDSGWTFYAENDLFAPSQDDNAYTGGLALSLSGPRSAQYPLSLDPLLGAINRRLPIEALHDESGMRHYSFEVGIAGFTPTDTEVKAPLFEEHPYACLTFLTGSRLDVQPGQQSAYLSSFTLGLLGTGLCEKIQSAVHHAEGVETPAGWDNQISDGGELTGMWTLSREELLSSGGDGAGSTDISAHVETAIGLSTHVGAGLNWRRGRIKSPWWSSTPHHAEYVSLGDLKPYGARGEWYFFAGFRAQYRLYSGLLQGQFRESAVTFSRDELRPLVLEGWGGFATSLTANTEVAFRLHSRRSEIKDKPASSWGSIAIRHRF